MKKSARREAGAVLLTVAMFLVLLLGFLALGIETGRWYLVRAELSKTVDAAALAGARNISNPHVDPSTLASEFTVENFPGGALGTPASGAGSATFSVTMPTSSKLRVEGHASAVPILPKLVGFNLVPVTSVGIAQKRAVEIMLVLDRSGSMSENNGIGDLKVAAKSFVDYFVATQDKDKMGLISFSTAATLNRALGINFVTPIKAAIDAMSASGHTNAEDAIDQADAPQGFTDQTGVPGDDRVSQFMIFFSDGKPNTFRGKFVNQGTTYDAVVFNWDNCDLGVNEASNFLYRPDVSGEQQFVPPVTSTPTGDGIFPGSACLLSTTKWKIFDTYPVPGYAPNACAIPNTPGGPLGNYVCNLATTLAVVHAGELKDEGVVCYSIGLGEKINQSFLEQLASGPAQVYIAPKSSDLKAIFQKIAQDIKLRLVQ